MLRAFFFIPHSFLTQSYCFSDSDAMKSILNHKIQGKSFTKESEVFKKKDAEEVAEKDEIYKLGAAHKAWMLFVRDTIWKLSSWKNRELLKWLDRTGADVIFFAPGDGAFIYRIADEIARYLNKPLIMVCMDDFFINNRNKKEILGGIRQKNFMRVVNKTAKDCDMIFTICDEMNDAYGKLFEKKCLTLHTVAERKNVQLAQTARHVSYIGNLKCGRYKTLIDIGKALSELRDENVPNVIDVYSGTREFDCIEPLKKAPGINFCGEISAESVLEVKLCVLKKLSCMKYESICYMDTDVYIQGSFDAIWTECRQNIMLYDINHGLNTRDYVLLCDEIESYCGQRKLITHYGGEFFAASAENAKAFVDTCEQVYYEMLQKNFITTKGDEFILSLAVNEMRESIKNAGAYIYRFWTGTGFRLISTCYEYNRITILHLPAEKERGMLKMYDKYIKIGKIPVDEKVWKTFRLNKIPFLDKIKKMLRNTITKK